MVVLAVIWEAKSGHEAEVAELFKALEADSRNEPGCLMFMAHRHRTDQRRFFIYEQYRDDHALEAHRNAPYFQKYVANELPKIASRVEGELYKPLDDV